MRLRIVDIAIREKLPYRLAYDAVLAGKFGLIEREGSKIFVVVPDPAPVPQPA